MRVKGYTRGDGIRVRSHSRKRGSKKTRSQRGHANAKTLLLVGVGVFVAYTLNSAKKAAEASAGLIAQQGQGIPGL